MVAARRLPQVVLHRRVHKICAGGHRREQAAAPHHGVKRIFRETGIGERLRYQRASHIQLVKHGGEDRPLGVRQGDVFLK